MFERLGEWWWNTPMQQWLWALGGVCVVLVAAHLAKRSIEKHVANIDARYRTRKFVSLASYLIAGIVVVNVFQERLGSFTVFVGMAGAGIAFALQEVIASVAGWVAISFGGFYSPGDRVQVGGIKGDVIDVSILRTTLMEVGEWVAGDLYTGRVVRVANSFVFKEPVFNYSADFPFVWDEIRVPVRYGSDWKAARTMLQALVDEALTAYASEVRESWKTFARRYRLEDANVDPAVTLAATDNWIEYTVRYVVDYRKRRGMKDHLFTKILEHVDASEGRIRLASATFEMAAGSTLDVHLTQPVQQGQPTH